MFNFEMPSITRLCCIPPSGCGRLSTLPPLRVLAISFCLP